MVSERLELAIEKRISEIRNIINNDEEIRQLYAEFISVLKTNQIHFDPMFELERIFILAVTQVAETSYINGYNDSFQLPTRPHFAHEGG